MKLEKHIDRALLKSELHWRENVRDFPWRENYTSKDDWFFKNGLSEKCALCCLKSGHESCRDMPCPLFDISGPCCEEWRSANHTHFLKKRHIHAVHRRIVRECKKRGLTLLEEK